MRYQTLQQALQNLIQDETDALANLSNSAALLFHSMEEINWAGFYLYKENQLIIACDAASASEIVIPIMKDDQLLGVLDVDSPKIGRFSELDRLGLQGFTDLLSAMIRWEELLR